MTLRLFLPDPAGARQIDEGVRHRVADGLAAVADALAPSLPESHAALDRLTDALRTGPVRPAVVAIYSDLVSAIALGDAGLLGDSLASATALADLASPGACRAVTLRDADLGPGMAASYLRHADDDPDVVLDIAAVDPGTLVAARTALAAATALVRSADPDLADEVDALIREVVFARAGDGGPGFGGATTFYLWGAILLNVEAIGDIQSLAENLVHEAAHARLLGATHAVPMVRNPPDQRFASPLRPDARPMEGIVHANYVIARLHYLAGRTLEGTGRAARLSEYRAMFDAADAIVAAEARFTEDGAALYGAARDYMRAAGD